VCKTWRDAVYNRRVWHGVEAKLHLTHTNWTPFPSLIRRGIKRVQLLSMRRGARDALAAAIRDLESLSLRGCHGLTDVAISPALETHLPALISLDISLCRQLTDSTLSRVVSVAPNLETLDVGGCSDITDNGILLIACGLKRLRSLCLRSCRLVSDVGVAHLAGAGSIAASAAVAGTLERLILHDCQRITDTALGHIGAGLRTLRTLDISFCVGVSDDGLRCVARLPMLQELHARACDGLTDVGIAYLAAASRLAILDIAFCMHVTDRALLHLVHSSATMPHLRQLYLSACAITDEGIDHITNVSGELRSLGIGQCLGVTDSGLAMIADRLKCIEYVDVYGCTLVTSVGLDKLRQLPSLKVLNLSLCNVT